MRPRQVNFRASDEELLRLRIVAAHYGLSGANVVRLLVKRAYDELRDEEKRHLKKLFAQERALRLEIKNRATKE
jgi:hypothetical protein